MGIELVLNPHHLQTLDRVHPHNPLAVDDLSVRAVELWRQDQKTFRIS